MIIKQSTRLPILGIENSKKIEPSYFLNSFFKISICCSQARNSVSISPKRPLVVISPIILVEDF